MPVTRIHILLWSLLSGVLWACAWPAVGGLFPLAFIAWLPLLHAERLHELRTAGRRVAFMPYAFAAALVWNAACSWWLYAVSEPLATRLVSGTVPIVLNALLMALPWWLRRMVRARFGPTVGGCAFVAFWLAFERLHHAWDLQWPWFSMGNVFGMAPWVVQWYEVTGMAGGSLWVLLVNLLADRVVVGWRSKRIVKGAILWLSTVLLVPLIASLVRFGTYEERGQAIEVVVVQPSIDPYTQKFGGMAAAEQLERMLALAEAAMTDSTHLVVLPETALQEATTVDMSGGFLRLIGLWENDLNAAQSVQRLRRFQREHLGTAVLAGMSSDSLLPKGVHPSVSARPLFRPDVPPGEQRWYMSYNAALFLPTNGKVGAYHKSKLVAGVELMPFERFLGPLGDLALDLGGTTGSLGQQRERTVFDDPGAGLRIVPAICYESVFGEHVAAHVRNGGEIIAIMTNDAWWGNTPGYRQHLTFASIRAIENRRSVVRSANTGISCAVDQRGVVHGRTGWWEATASRHVVRANAEHTFFTRHGDLIGRMAVFASGACLLLCLVRWKRRAAN
jgi:apolipoprotein N-acyltransferase